MNQLIEASCAESIHDRRVIYKGARLVPDESYEPPHWLFPETIE
jgi:hypothetical protein